MTFQRWARLLIGVLKADDFIASTVKADNEGEAKSCGSSRPAMFKFTIKRPSQKLQNNNQRCYHLINKISHWQVKYNQADLSFWLRMITADTILCLLTQCKEKARCLSLPPLTFPTTELHRPIDFNHSRIHELVTVITSRHRALLQMREVTKVNFVWPSDKSANGSLLSGNTILRCHTRFQNHQSHFTACIHVKVTLKLLF